MKNRGINSNTNNGQKKKKEIEAPVCLGDLFAENSEDADDQAFSQLYEVQDLDIGGTVFKIRQFAWHGANANKVWPGTFNLAEHICLHKGDRMIQAFITTTTITDTTNITSNPNPINIPATASTTTSTTSITANTTTTIYCYDNYYYYYYYRYYYCYCYGYYCC
jgi:hypothetical protein